MPTPVQLGIITNYPKRLRTGPSRLVVASASAGVITITVNGTSAGNALVIPLVLYGATTTVSSITCSGESNPTASGSLYRAGGGILSDAAIVFYYVPQLTSGGTKTITITLSASSTAYASSYEISGQDPVNFLDTTANAAAGNVNIATAQQTEGLFFIGVSGGAQTSPFEQNHFASSLQRNEFYVGLNMGAAGTYNANFSGSGNNIIYAMTVKAAL